MTLDDWRAAAIADATRRGRPELVPLIEMLARATAALRATDWSAADGASGSPPAGPRSPRA